MKWLKYLIELPFKVLQSKEKDDNPKKKSNEKDVIYHYGRRSKEIRKLVDYNWRDLGYKTGLRMKGSIEAMTNDISSIKAKFFSEWSIQLGDLKIKLEELTAKEKYILESKESNFLTSELTQIREDLSTVKAYIDEIESYLEKDQTNDKLLDICVKEYTAGFSLGKAEYLDSNSYKDDLSKRLMPDR